MLLKRGIEIGSVNMIKLVAIWEVANGKILVLLIPKFIVYLLMTLMFSTFTLAIILKLMFRKTIKKKKSLEIVRPNSLIILQ